MEPKFTYCAEEHGNYSWIKCHTDADCPEAWDNPCSPEGGCYGDLRTDNGVAGDVRSGFILCEEPESGNTSTCGPGTGCCTSGNFGCADGIEQCGEDSPRFDSCDGPEDCPAGEQCWELQKHFGCAANPQTSGSVLCHTDADCVMPEVNPCENGFCSGRSSDLPG